MPILCLLIFIGGLLSDDFQIENTKVFFEVEEVLLERPFSGGLNRPRIQWVDWNNDGDTDLFVLDQDGYIRYYQNSSESDVGFDLVTTSFFNIFAKDTRWFNSNAFKILFQ